MNNKGSSEILIGFIAFASVAGGLTLFTYPTLLSGIWSFLAWSFVVMAAIVAGILQYTKRLKEKLHAQKILEKQRRKRAETLRKEQEKREKKIEALRESLIKKEEKNAEKWARIKSELVKEEGKLWAGRIELAEREANLARNIAKETKHMPIRNAAGQLVLLWHETSSLAQWTAQQIIMFSRRPSVTTEAREEAQEAIIKAAEIREKGGNWTKEKGKELAKLKDKAREESKIEEERLDTIKNTIENAEIKWRSSEVQIKRWQAELDRFYTNKN